MADNISISEPADPVSRGLDLVGRHSGDLLERLNQLQAERTGHLVRIRGFEAQVTELDREIEATLGRFAALPEIYREARANAAGHLTAPTGPDPEDELLAALDGPPHPALAIELAEEPREAVDDAPAAARTYSMTLCVLMAVWLISSRGGATRLRPICDAVGANEVVPPPKRHLQLTDVSKVLHAQKAIGRLAHNAETSNYRLTDAGKEYVDSQPLCLRQAALAWMASQETGGTGS